MTTEQLITSSCGRIGVVNGHHVAIASNRMSPSRHKMVKRNRPNSPTVWATIVKLHKEYFARQMAAIAGR